MSVFNFKNILFFVTLTAVNNYAVAESYNFRMFGGYISIPVDFSVDSIVVKRSKCYEVVFSRKFEKVNDTDIALMSYVMCDGDEYKFDDEQVKEVDRKKINGFDVVNLEYIDSTSKIKGKRFFRTGEGNSLLYFFGENGFEFAETLLATYEEL